MGGGSPCRQNAVPSRLLHLRDACQTRRGCACWRTYAPVGYKRWGIERIVAWGLIIAARRFVLANSS